MVAKTQLSKHANKRTDDQIRHDRNFAMELRQRGKDYWTYERIAEKLEEVTGRRISSRQVGYDLQKLREQWLEEDLENYSLYIKEELSRLEAYENELWDAWRSSKADVTKERVEKAMRRVQEEEEGMDLDEQFKLVINKVVTTTENSVGDARFLELIYKAQQERRKLLGLYAPARLNITEEHTLNIKGYAGGVSPDDWPGKEENIVEGEFTDAG